MPQLRQISCSIQWPGSNAPFPEYGTLYGDGVVETYIVVPNKPQTFTIHVRSKSFIYEGLAAIVFVDGNYQTNRNRVNLTRPAPNQPLNRTEVNFLIRQKEKVLGDGTYMGREWRFDDHNIVHELPEGVKENHFDELGTIEVLILRCHARLPEEAEDSCSSSGADSDVFCERRDGGVAEDSSAAKIDSMSKDVEADELPSTVEVAEEAIPFGLGIFDGVDERGYRINLDGSTGPSNSWPWQQQHQSFGPSHGPHPFTENTGHAQSLPYHHQDPATRSPQSGPSNTPYITPQPSRSQKHVHFDFGPAGEPPPARGTRQDPVGFRPASYNRQRSSNHDSSQPYHPEVNLQADHGSASVNPTQAQYPDQSQAQMDRHQDHHSLQVEQPPIQSQSYVPAPRLIVPWQYPQSQIAVPPYISQAQGYPYYYQTPHVPAFLQQYNHYPPYDVWPYTTYPSQHPNQDSSHPSSQHPDRPTSSGSLPQSNLVSEATVTSQGAENPTDQSGQPSGTHQSQNNVANSSNDWDKSWTGDSSSTAVAGDGNQAIQTDSTEWADSNQQQQQSNGNGDGFDWTNTDTDPKTKDQNSWDKNDDNDAGDNLNQNLNINDTSKDAPWSDLARNVSDNDGRNGASNTHDNYGQNSGTGHQNPVNDPNTAHANAIWSDMNNNTQTEANQTGDSSSGAKPALPSVYNRFLGVRPLFGPHGQYYTWTPPTADAPPPDAEEEPRYDVPLAIADAKGITKQVQPGQGYLYYKKRSIPEYTDSVAEPYARFVFKYRTKEQLKNEIGVDVVVEPTGDEATRELQDMNKEALIEMLLRAKTALGGKIPSPPLNPTTTMDERATRYHIPVPVEPPPRDFLKYQIPPGRIAGIMGNTAGHLQQNAPNSSEYRPVWSNANQKDKRSHYTNDYSIAGNTASHIQQPQHFQTQTTQPTGLQKSGAYHTPLKPFAVPPTSTHEVLPPPRPSILNLTNTSTTQDPATDSDPFASVAQKISSSAKSSPVSDHGATWNPQNSQVTPAQNGSNESAANVGGVDWSNAQESGNPKGGW